MDSAYEVDRDALLRTVRTADHVIVRFATIPQRLFVDFRTRKGEGPGVHLLPAVNSMQERMASIAAARPGFPRPGRLCVVAWPLRVGGLQRLGFVDAVRQRLAAMDAFAQLRALDAACARLRVVEREEIRCAITGEGYRTLWAGRAAR